MDRLALYARVSTRGQDASNQIERLEAWAKQKGFVIEERFVETASGKDPSREVFRKAIRLARGNRFDHLAVTKIDRWARSVIDLDRTVRELADNGVTFWAIDQGVRFQRGHVMGKAFIQFLGILAEMEAGLISERTKEGLKGKNPGRPKKACEVCGGSRNGSQFAKVAGKRRAVCAECKDLDPEVRRERFRIYGGGEA